MYGKIPKISFRGNGITGVIYTPSMFKNWHGMATAVRKKPGVNLDKVIEKAEEITGQGYKQIAKKSHSSKEIETLLKSVKISKQKGDGLFFPNMPISAQNGSGTAKKKLKKLGLSSSLMAGHGFRFE